MGNTGTSPSTNFLGTIDSQPLVIRTNGIEALRVLAGSGTTGGSVGIGTTSPAFRLDVNGDVNGTTLREGGITLGLRYLRLDGTNAPAGGVPISITGNAATATTAGSFSGSLAGDVQGGQTTTKVVALQGTPLGSTAPSSGQLLQFTGTQWAPAPPPGVQAVGATAPLSSSGGANPTLALTGVVPIANGGTGAATQSFVDLTTTQTVGGTKTFSQPINGSITGTAAGDWTSTGNAGTSPSTNFLGTTDNQPLEVRVNNQRALRLEPANLSPNLIGGSSANSVAAGTTGATIAGGGQAVAPNVVNGTFGTIGGGVHNTAGAATVAGGAENTASGDEATVGGGDVNTASGASATVGGGGNNAASAASATVSGGGNNLASGLGATVGGGQFNTAAGANSFAAGSGANVQATHPGTFLFADNANGNAFNSAAANEFAARATGDVRFVTAVDATGNPTAGATLTSGSGTNVVGAIGNQPLEVSVNNQRALRLEPTSVSPNVIGGFSGNSVAAGTYGATIAGGGELSGVNVVTAPLGVIGGGFNNIAGAGATIGGGGGNTASGEEASVVGGANNTASGAGATVGGGGNNGASGLGATVGGGQFNTAAGANSFAAGFGANVQAAHSGTFLYADGTNNNGLAVAFSSAAANEFAARATGGVRFVTAVDASGNPTAGVTLASGSGSWSSLSDRNAKANFTAVDGRDILARVRGLPIQTWNYRGQDAATRHLGPMAQDFHAAFGVGEDDTHIDTVDAEG
jgi:hypothetical protein